MPTYISLFQKTRKGRENIAEAQERRERGLELLEEHDCEVIGLYYSLSRYDFVGIWECPDTESLAKVQIAYEQLGLSHLESFQVFDSEEWDAILEDAVA